MADLYNQWAELLGEDVNVRSDKDLRILMARLRTSQLSVSYSSTFYVCAEQETIGFTV